MGVSKGVVTTDNIPKGKLCLVAATPSCYLTKVDLIKHKMVPVPSSAIDCGVAFKHPKHAEFEVNVYLNPKTQVRDLEPQASGQVNKLATDEFLCPFWLVAPTSDEGAANMALHLRTSVAPGTTTKISIPIMENTKALKAGTELKYFKKNNSTVKWQVKCVTDGATLKKGKH